MVWQQWFILLFLLGLAMAYTAKLGDVSIMESV
jgi:hypothetical protein